MKYVCLSSDAKLIGRTLHIFFNKPFPFADPSVPDLMYKYGLSEVKETDWYDLQTCLNLFEELENCHGSEALELIGFKTLSDVHDLKATDLEADLIYFDTGYQLTHMNEDIGYYELIHFDKDEKKAVMETMTPYPPALNKGCFIAVLRKHIPIERNCIINITLQEKKEYPIYRYNISWE